MMTTLRRCLVLMLLALTNMGIADAAEKAFIVAIAPQFSPTQTQRNWSPLLERLEKATGYGFQIRAYDQVSSFEAELDRGIPDLAFMSPHSLLLTHGSQGYVPLVRDGQTKLKGILVVKRNGAIHSVRDLDGKEMAVPSANAFAASLYMRALLAEKENVRLRTVVAGNHQNVYRQVMMGQVAAGGGIQTTLDKEPQGVRDRLTILYATPETAPHAFAAHPRVSPDIRKRITEAFLSLGADPANASLFHATQITKPVAADYDRDYAHLQSLKLDRYLIRSEK
jgi:phosphonate transport system substrate-binding protein